MREFKFKVGDIVKIINEGERYANHGSWFDNQNVPHLKERWSRGQRAIVKFKYYVVIHRGPHSDHNHAQPLYFIKEWHGSNHYLFGEAGLSCIAEMSGIAEPFHKRPPAPQRPPEPCILEDV